MSQTNEYVISGSPLTMAQLATELEELFAAAASCNRGATAPTNPFQGMLWWDTSADPVETLKRYTIAGGWVSLLSINNTSGVVTAFGTRGISGTTSTNFAIIADLTTHAALTDTHGATATPAASRIAMYDSDLRLKSGAAPSAAADVLRLGDAAATTLTLGGGFGGTNNLRLTKIGSIVVATWGSMSQASGSSATSTAGVIPSSYRPVIDTTTVHSMLTTFVSMMKVITDGTLQMSHRDWSGAALTTTLCPSGSMSWHTA
jgi:hypothetical protein